MLVVGDIEAACIVAREHGRSPEESVRDAAAHMEGPGR